MISFDTENSPDGTLTLCIFYNGEQYKIFDYKKFKNQYEMKEQIIEYILSFESEIFLAHNLEYDLVNILKPFFIYAVNWYYSGRLLFAEMALNKKVRFIDTFNFSFTSLKEIGKSIGIEKIDTEDFYNIEYCKQDAKIAYEYYKKFSDTIKDDYNLKCKKTLAGTSQQILLKKYITDRIDGINVDERILNGYYGGRCEVFNLHRINRYIVEVDVNSMYPFVMKNNVYPVTEFYESIEPAEKYYLSKIRVKIKDDVYLPIIPKREGLLYFPRGEFETYCTSMEIEKAIEENQIEKIEYLETFNFPDCQNVFDKFVSDIYGKREIAKNKGMKFNSSIYKYILNSSYGRFALHKSMKMLTEITDENYDIIEPVNEDVGWIEIKNETTKNKNYAIAAYITAYARVELYKIISRVMELDYIPLYCDTDSCYFTSRKKIKMEKIFNDIYEQFTIGNKLGNLSAHIYCSGQFHNAKVYELVDFANSHKIKMKGIPEKFRKEFLEDGKTSYKKPLKLRSGLRGVQGKEMNVWYEHEVYKRSDYKKREVLKNGETMAKKFIY